MIRQSARTYAVTLLFLSLAISSVGFADDNHSNVSSNTPVADAAKAQPLKNVVERFKDASVKEAPDFQKHVSPLLGRLGCNGRSCHGSFQGQGGFQLSLFGYDFSADHKALMDEGRVDVHDWENSLIITKPTDEDSHEGGERYAVGSWQYNLLKRWIEDGAKHHSKIQQLKELVVEPANLQLVSPDKTVQLKATAHWQDGTVEDVTPLCRFQSNNDSIAKITENGAVSTDTVPGDTHVVVFYDNAVVPVPVVHPIAGNVGSPGKPIPTPSPIDRLTAEKWSQLGIEPSELSDDVMFLRRVSLDITGTLPTPQEIRKFVEDTDPQKRRNKINELLESPAYAAWWTTFFCDMTENNTAQLRNISFNNNQISDLWYDWIYSRVESNTPYDEMISGIVTGTSRSNGESYADYCERMSQISSGKSTIAESDSIPFYWMRREFQDRDARAISFAHAFLGLRIQCAQCHKHPFDQWTQSDFKEFSKFFSGVTLQNYGGGKTKEEKAEYAQILEDLGLDPNPKNRNDNRKKLATFLKKGETVPFGQLVIHDPKPTREELQAFRKEVQQARKEKRKLKFKQPPGVTSAKLLGDEVVDLGQHNDIREPLMEWMRRDNNPFFARALVNRVWARYFGVGIVDPADDLNMANPPSNKPLLDYLAKEFVKHDFDLKWLHREIANSRTYQLSWKPNDTNSNDRRNFSRALPRRLPAEVVFDAVMSSASNASTNLGFRDSIDDRAISIPGTAALNKGRKTSGVSSDFALQVFGRSERSSSCDCDRSEETSLMQTVYMQNDRDIHLLLTHKNSWINQMAREFTGSGLSSKEENTLRQGFQNVAGLERQRNGIVKQKQNLEKQKNTDKKHLKRIKDAEKRIQKLDKSIADARKRIEPLQKRKEAFVAKIENVDLDAVVEEAYLRTLSRFPTQAETQRCSQHISESKNLIEGVKGIMWALVNTKEFIVNH